MMTDKSHYFEKRKKKKLIIQIVKDFIFKGLKKLLV